MTKKSLLIVFVLSYAFAAIFFALGYKVYSPAFALFGMIYMWIPGIVGLIFANKEGIRLPVFRFNRYYLLAGLAAAAASLGALAISYFFMTGWNPIFLEYGRGVPFYLLIAFGLGITINAIAAMGEEIYWRGYLQEKLKMFSPLKTSLLTGLIWGVWHAPLIAMGYNYPGHPIAGSLMMILVACSLSPILYYFRVKGDSIVPAAAFHGVFNGFSGLAFLFFTKPNYFLMGSTGVIGIVIFSLLSLWALCALKRKQGHAN